MGQVPELGLAASARAWPDRLHRHVLDHGGARIAGRILTATQALDTAYDVLLIDDVCSFLSPGLVDRLRRDGRQVLGVFDSGDGPDAKRRLLECGIADVIEADASADEFLGQAAALVLSGRSAPLIGPGPRIGRTIGVLGVAPGVGATEIAVGLAWSLSHAVDTVLVDVDLAMPSVAQRLDLPPHPNLLTLIDTVVHGYPHDEVEIACGGLRVVPGMAQPDRQGLPPHEIEMALEAMGARSDVVVADLGAAPHVGHGTLGNFDALVVVATGDPVGVTRLLRHSTRLQQLAETASLLVVANRCPPMRFHRGELEDEIEAALGAVPLIALTHDNQVTRSSWEGEPVAKGRFAREMKRMANLVAAAVRR